MPTTRPEFASIRGADLGFGSQGELVARTTGANVQRTHPCVNATVTVSDEATNVRTITIQLLDADGNDMATPTTVTAQVYLDANGTNQVATGGSTGIEAGTDGEILETAVAKKRFVLRSEDDGDIDLTWTDTGSETAYFAITLPNGVEIFGDQALTNA